MSLNVVSYIRSHGIEPIDTLPQITEDGKSKFWFEDTEELRNLLTQYNNDMELQLFIGKLRQTKSDVHLARKANGIE